MDEVKHEAPEQHPAQAQETQVSEAQTQEVRTQEAQTPEAQTQEARTQEARTQEAQTPEAQTQEARTQEAHDTEARTLEAHDTEARTLEAHNTEAHNTEAHAAEAHAAEAHDTEAHAAEAHAAGITAGPDIAIQSDGFTYSKPFQNKAQGWIFLNGNVSREEDLVKMCREQILHPQHFDAEADERKKVLLITAAFQKGHEHHDRHLIEMFEHLSIDAKWENDFPRNIQNLSVWSMFNTFKARETWLHRKYTEKQDRIKAVKQDYLLKNSHYVESAHQLAKDLGRTYPNLTMFDFYNIEEYGSDSEIFTTGVTQEQSDRKLMDLKSLAGSPLDKDLCKELRATIDHLIFKDQEVFDLCQYMEDYFLDKSGITNTALYKEQRLDLEERITSSATIFIFGGRVYVLVNRLRFYRLDEVFKRVLARGANIYGISAGTLCQMSRFYLNLERFTPGGYLRAADSGMGLVEGLWVTPHAEDYAYIREAHPDALSFFSIRQKNGVMVGLSEKSVLLYEKYKDPMDGNIYKRYTSVGEEPVLIFGVRGMKHEMARNSQIILEGTKFYQGRNMVGEEQDIEELEREYWKKMTGQKEKQAIKI
ncbi:MAG: Type 1 glutamine amidotransferase-like domain-containing protein [Vulcanimicrobiota bacterium]